MAPGEKYKAPATIKPYDESEEPSDGATLQWDSTANDFVPGIPIIALTQAEYDALDPPDASTLYVITDAA